MFVPVRVYVTLVSCLLGLSVSACAQSAAATSATETAIAATIYADLTARAPTATSTELPASPTPEPTATPALIPLADIDSSGAFLLPADLTFGGSVATSKWIECQPGAGTLDYWIAENDSGLVWGIRRSWAVDKCAFESPMVVLERILVFESERQALRMSDALRKKLANQSAFYSFTGVLPTIQVTEYLDGSVWTSVSSTGLTTEFVLHQGQLVIDVSIFSETENFVEADLLELAQVAITRVLEQQQP